MKDFQDLGVTLAIDDFCTGYSSLTYLRRFPLDTLKIDGSFVQAMLRERNSMQTVRAIAQLAQTQRMDVIAESIEIREALAPFREFGCDTVATQQVAQKHILAFGDTRTQNIPIQATNPSFQIGSVICSIPSIKHRDISTWRSFLVGGLRSPLLIPQARPKRRTFLRPAAILIAAARRAVYFFA